MKPPQQPIGKRIIKRAGIMNKIGFIPVVFFAVMPMHWLFAQQPPPEVKKASVTGSILSTTGEPLKKAQISLHRAEGGVQSGYAAVSDAAGAFRLSDIEPGKYSLYVERTGYVQQQYNSRQGRSGSILTLAEGKELTGIVIKLVPQGVISGKVTDEDGDPVPQCGVLLLSQRYVQGKRQFQQTGGTQINDLGEFRIANLAPGKYRLSVTCQIRTVGLIRTGLPKDAPEEGYATTYYPGVVDMAQATAIDVAAGNELRGIDLRLVKARTYHIRGKVIDAATNLPAREVSLSLIRSDTGPMYQMGSVGTAVRNAAGAFDIGSVLPGSYFLIANRMNAESRSPSQQPVEVGNQNVNDLTVTVGSGFQLSGLIKVEGNETVDLSAVRLFLEPANGLPIGGATLQVKPDGAFTGPNVSALRYRLRTMNMPDGTYMKTIRMGSQEIGDFLIDLTTGAPGPIEVVVSAKAGQIKGTVEDEKQQPAANATIILVPEASKRDQFSLFKQTTADQNGAFTVKGLPPGEYTLFSWEEIEDGAWQDPEFLKKYEADGIKVKVAEGSSETAKVKMIPSVKDKPPDQKPDSK
jgi:hypothetical protein